MNLYQLEYFLKLAERLNFTQAAKELHITQPNLSKTIMKLEEDLGVDLFVRSHRNVHLTAAGRTFYQEVNSLMDNLEIVLDYTRQVGEGSKGFVEVGFLGTALLRLLPPFIREFRQQYPKIEVRLHDYTFTSLQNALVNRDIDVALLPNHGLGKIQGLKTRPIYFDQMCAVLPLSHPLAQEESIELWEIKDEDFILVNPEISYQDYDLVLSMCLDQDFIPQVPHQVNTLLNCTMMVECDMGITILSQHMSRLSNNTHLRFVPLKGYEQYFKIVCAWYPGHNPAINHLVDVITEVTTAPEKEGAHEHADL